MKQELLNEKEVAVLLGLSVYTLQKRRRTGNFIPFIKLGRSVKYAQRDVTAYLEQQSFTSTSQYPGGDDVK